MFLSCPSRPPLVPHLLTGSVLLGLLVNPLWNTDWQQRPAQGELRPMWLRLMLCGQPPGCREDRQPL